MFWSDGTKSCSVSGPSSRGKRVGIRVGKRIRICHAGSSEGFVENSILLCGKKLSESWLPRWYELNCIGGLVWEYVNSEFTQRKNSSDSDR